MPCLIWKTWLTAALLAAPGPPAPSPPAKALAKLAAGNRRYLSHHLRNPIPLHGAERALVAQKQKPFAIVLACSDSRVVPELIFDQRLGALFIILVAGNITDPVVLGSVEYAAEQFGCPLVLVLGHQRCGAVTAAVEAKEPPTGNLGAILKAIRPAVERARALCAGAAGPQLVECAVQQNIREAERLLVEGSPVLARLVWEGRLVIAGGEYHLDTGLVRFLPPEPAPKAQPAP
ncbi:MAG: carbonic anhydrase [Holophaga sp.]|jgi:carbonic anhydrase